MQPALPLFIPRRDLGLFRCDSYCHQHDSNGGDDEDEHNHCHHHHRVGSSSVRLSDFLVSLSPSSDSPRKISAIICCLGLWSFFVWLFPIQVWSLDYCLVLDLSSVQWIPDVSRMSNAGYWSSNWLISSNFHALIISSFSQFMSLMSNVMFHEWSVVSFKITCWNAPRVSICLLVTKKSGFKSDRFTMFTAKTFSICERWRRQEIGT